MRGGDRAAIAKCSPFNSSKCRSRTKYGGAWERIVAEPFQHTRTASLCASILFVFIMPLVYLWRLVYSDFVKKCLIFFPQYYVNMIPVMRSFDSVCIFQLALYFLCRGRLQCIFLLSRVLSTRTCMYIELVHQLFYNCKACVHIVHLVFTPCLHLFFDSLDRALLLITPHVLVHITDHWWTWCRCFHASGSCKKWSCISIFGRFKCLLLYLL